MAYELIIKPIVFFDVEEALDYYEQQSSGLGKRFYENFLLTLQNIQNSPTHYAFIYQSVRRCMIYNFPYKVFYTVTEHNIFILGVAHAKRSNTFIRKRLRL